MAVRVDEDSRIAAPEGLAARPDDPRAGLLRLGDDRVHLLRQAHVVRQRDAAPAALVFDSAVLGELISSPQGDDHAAGLEEDDVVRGRRARTPAEGLVEGPGASEIRHPEGNEAQPLFHPSALCWPLGRRVEQVLDATDAAHLADAGLERLDELGTVDLTAEEDDTVLRVDVDPALGDVAVAEDDRLDLVHERRVVDLAGASARVPRALDKAARVRRDVVDELAAPLRPVLGERKGLVARDVPAPAALLRVEVVGKRRAPSRGGEIERELAGAHDGTSGSRAATRKATLPRNLSAPQGVEGTSGGPSTTRVRARRASKTGRSRRLWTARAGISGDRVSYGVSRCRGCSRGGGRGPGGIREGLLRDSTFSFRSAFSALDPPDRRQRSSQPPQVRGP